jgi:tetratricopeptide (TPR) repeat protein
MKLRIRGSRQGFERAAQLRSEGELAQVLGLDVANISWESPSGPLASSDDQLVAGARQDSERVTAKQLDTIASDIASIKALLLQSSLPAAGLSGDTPWHALLDDARGLLQAGDARAAMRLVQYVREQTSTLDDTNLQFRIAMNLGCAALALDDYDSALAEFQQAAAIERTAKAVANIAMALFAKRRYAEALEEARAAVQIDTTFRPAVAAVIKSLAALEQFEQIDSLIARDPSLTEDNDVLLALGEARFRQGSYRAGEHYCRMLLPRRPDDANVRLLTAECIVGRINNDSERLLGELDEVARTDLLEAKAHAQAAKEYFVATNQQRPMIVALNNQGAILALLEDYSAAIECANIVLSHDATNEIALQNRGLSYFQLGDFAHAIVDFEALSETEYADAVALPFGDALLKLGEVRRSAELLRSAWNARSDDDPQALQAGELLLNAYAELDDAASHEVLLREIEATFGADPVAQAILALAEYRKGDTSRAIQRLTDAFAAASGTQQALIAPRLADLFIDQKRFGDAADLYERVSLQKDPRHFATYLKCLVNAQRYAEAYALATVEIDRGTSDTVVYDVAARVATYNGDLHAARDTYLHALRVGPSARTLRFRLSLAQVHVQLGERDAAIELIQPLTAASIEDADDLLMVARLRTLLGLSGALPFAYHAREIAFHDPDVHLAYVRLFLARSELDKPILDADEVAIGTTVHVTLNNEPRTFAIVATATEARHASDIAQDSSLGRYLLGKRAGDEIVIRDTPVERVVARITEVVTKYVAAFRETLEQFSTWFPDNLALQKGRTDDDSLRRVAEAMNVRGTSIRTLFEGYQQGTMSLHGFADLAGERLPDAWWKIVSTPGVAVISDAGDRTRLEDEYRAVEASTTCVVETTALLTLSYVGLLPQLKERFATVAVVQRSIDDLLEDVAQQRTLPGRVALTDERQAEDLRRQLVVVDAAIAFAQREATAVAPRALLETSADDLEKKARLLGAGGLPSILAAVDLSAVILSDDVVFREVARSSWDVPGASTQTLLRHLTERGVISSHQYSDALVQLASAGYQFLTLRADDLLWVLDRNGMRYSDEVSAFFRNLEGPHCTEDSAVTVLADLVRLIALHGVTSRASDNALDVIMRTLTTGRQPRRSMARFRDAVSARLSLLPLELDRALKTIDAWRAAQSFRIT